MKLIRIFLLSIVGVSVFIHSGISQGKNVITIKGTPKFGGPKHPTSPFDHILHIYNVWKVGGYIVYHHDMFQTGYVSEAIPPNGIPAPGFSEYHDQIFQFLGKRERYLEIIR